MVVSRAWKARRYYSGRRRRVQSFGQVSKRVLQVSLVLSFSRSNSDLASVIEMLSRYFRGFDKSKKRQTADEDGEALLSSSTDSLPAESLAHRYEKEPTTIIVIRTALLCTAVYIGIGIWFGLIVKHTNFINDADKSCLNHISQYCESMSSRMRPLLTFLQHH